MSTRTLTITPGPTVTREAITKTSIFGNPGFSHSFNRGRRPLYIFNVEVTVTRPEAEYLWAMHALHMGNKSMFWDGATFGDVRSHTTIDVGDDQKTEFFLPNRYVTATSFSARTLRPSTGATSNQSVTLNAYYGLVQFGTAPASGDFVQAQYACRYHVTFDDNGLALSQTAVDLFTANFMLRENAIIVTDSG